MSSDSNASTTVGREVRLVRRHRLAQTLILCTDRVTATVAVHQPVHGAVAVQNMAGSGLASVGITYTAQQARAMLNLSAAPPIDAELGSPSRLLVLHSAALSAQGAAVSR